MEIYVPSTAKELSQRKLEEYDNYSKIVNEGRRNPIWFTEFMFGVKLIDYQKWYFMNSWWRKYVLWLCCRRAGKTTGASVFNMAKMLLFPNHKLYISTNSAAQSIEVFKMIEDIALKRVPSFRTCTDLFAAEVEKSNRSDTGFIHNPAGHSFRLFNGSELLTLSTNFNALRGKGGSVMFDETAWQEREQMAAVEHFADTDASFSLGTEKVHYYDPLRLPLQLMYASSAGDVEYPFYEKYRMFAKRMMMGDPNYFVCDINANTVLDFSTVDGQPIVAHLTKEAVAKAVEDDPDAADRELFNKFRKGGGKNALVRMETIMRNSVVRPPILFNDTGARKFILCYDPARSYDGSVLSVFELVDDKNVGFRLRVANVISMVDTETSNKTPLPMPQQLEIIKKAMIDYNGERAADWENIEFYIDSGSGGGGISAIADQLMEDWVDGTGRVRRGIIDPDHKQYQTARVRYPNAVSIVHLLDPQAYRKQIFDALEKMAKLDLIEFTDYDGNGYLQMVDEKGEFYRYDLSPEEENSLLQVKLAINEISYMCRFDLPNGGVQYSLTEEQKRRMHDDRAYTFGLGAFALSTKRRKDIVENKEEESEFEHAPSLVCALSY